MSRCVLCFFVMCCLAFFVHANEVSLPKNNADISEVIHFLKKNSINSPKIVISYIEDNKLTQKAFSNEEKIKVLSYYAQANQFIGEIEKANAMLTEAFTIISKSYVSADTQAIALFVRAAISSETTQYTQAINDLNMIIALYPKDSNNKNIGKTYQTLADTYLQINDYKNTFDALYKSQFVFKAIKDQTMLAVSYGRLGSVYRSIGDFDKALENMLKSLKALEGTQAERRVAITYNNTAIIYKDLGRYDEAINLHKRSLNLKEKIGYQRGMVYSYNNLGETYRLKGDKVQAQRYLDEAQALAVKLNNTMLLGSTYLYRARIAKENNKLEQALTHLDNAMTIYQKRNSKARISEAWVEYGDIYFAQDDFVKAETSYQHAIELSQAVQKNVVTFAAYEGLVNALKQQQNYQKALNALIVYQGLKSALFDKQSQQRLESLIVENQLFHAQQKLKLAQQEGKLKQAELERVETHRNWSAFTLVVIFIISWLIYRKVQQHNRIKMEVQAREALEESERRLNLALWGSGDTLWDWDLSHGEITRNNLPVESRLAERTLGLNTEALKDYVHPDDYLSLSQAFDAHINKKTPFFEANYRVLDKQGEWRWLLDRGKVVDTDEHGKALRITGTQRDITKLKQQEVALLELNSELEQRVAQRTTELATMNQQLMHTIEKLEVAQEYIIEAEKHAALGSMVAGLAHEINTPLGTAITAVSHLKMQTVTTESQFKSKTLSSQAFESFLNDVNNSSELIESGVGKAGELVERFKLLAGKNSEQKPTVINLSTLLLESFKVALNTLQRDPETANLTISGDVELVSFAATLAQVFNIIVENALLHADVPYVEITCELSKVGSGVEINFYDNGKNIEVGDEKRIFEPFYTRKRQCGYAGLGLHIAYNNVTQDLNGSIECYRDASKGLGYKIKLPSIEN
ncbi:C4-dicarboxylate transport sensor protein DctB [Pseudoalteromonas sp. P1-9]|uniref:tetratricopeptide repeat-containing sensor histidine kinase n=1 Tax=Pseudoalteromonas sp. P1-9 TaxID=1710354 RepID=UPI0006D5DF02|nr:tetratricopeptide repeat protein [Pseudoalteromonas sp. P1-9]KPV96301.1 C4-dicarboxylate transport sensor protein DctB [Pseudoalteromonas sp. P1-9]